MKILLAVDGSEYSQFAAQSVAQRPWPPDTEIKILSVMDLSFTPTPESWALPESYYSQVEAAAKESATSAVDATAELFKDHPSGVRISTATRLGQPKEAILEQANEWEADLIVLGSHGYSGWKRFWLGSVSQTIVAQAHCSVEIVKQRQA